MARVLVVEDDPVVAKVLEIALRQAGHEVRLATSFAEGERALQAPFDAMILDINLPGGSGLDLLRRLGEKGHSLPVIVLSGLKREKTVLEALSLGALDYLTKPFSPKELLLQLERYVASR